MNFTSFCKISNYNLNYNKILSQKNNLPNLLNNKHKIISIVGFIAITCFVTCNLISNYLKKKKFSHKNESKNTPLINDIFQKQSKDKSVESNISTKITLIEEPKVELKKETELQPLEEPKVTLNQETETQPKDNSKISQDKPKIPSKAFSLCNLPMDLLEGNIFSHLNIKEWNNLSLTDKNFQALSHNPKALASILNNSEPKIPLKKYIMLAQKAGPFLTKLNWDLTKNKLISAQNHKHFNYKKDFDLVEPITDTHLQEIFKACPNIRDLNFSNLIQQSTALSRSNQTIAILPKGLKSLDVSYFKNMTAATFANLPEGLKSLSLAGFHQLDDTAFANWPKKLRWLTLNCPNITKLTIDHLPQKLELLLLGHNQWKDEDLGNLPKSLKCLGLVHCPNITDATISNLPEQIEGLDLSDCPQLTVAMADHLPKGLKWIILPSQLKTTKIMDSLKLKGIDASFDN